MVIDILNSVDSLNPKVILSRMSEDGVCLLTGKKDDLTYVPVDMDTTNILPSNMVCVQKSLSKTMLLSYHYDVQFSDMMVMFDTPSHFERYNKTLLENISTSEIAGNHTVDRILSVYDLFTLRHVKGFFKISCGNYQVHRIQYQEYLLRLLAEKLNSSKIIQPLGVSLRN